MAAEKKTPTPDPSEELTALCQADLRVFLEEAWPTIVPAEPFQPGKHIDAVCEHLEALERREFENLLINIPPRHGKSNICSVAFPAWIWTRDPTFRMLFFSYGQQLSVRDSMMCRKLVESPWYQERWGYKVSIASDQNEKMNFRNTREGFRSSSSVGGAATGLGGDLIVVDDPHKTDEVESEDVRQGVVDWWNVVMPSRTGRGGRALRLVVMQRLHELDMSADIIKKGTYVHLCLPQEFESKRVVQGWAGWRDWRTEDGELLWPERFTAEVIEDTLKPPNMTSAAYAGQYQQRPAPAEGDMFLRKWWNYYKPIDVERMIETASDRCWSWDMAFKDLKSSDFVAGLAIIRDGSNFYLMPRAVHDRISFSKSKQAVRSCAAAYPGIHAKLVEDKANGTAVVEDLTNDKELGGLIAVDPRGGKESRASVLQPYVEAGNVFLPEGAPWVEEFLEEFRTFPNGKNDDFVDALSQAVIWLLGRVGKRFKPQVWSHSRSFGVKPHETYKDPRYGDAAVPVGYSERGDMPRQKR